MGIQPPKKQFDGPRRRYLDEPIRRCQEWTAEAIQALTSAGVLVVEEILLSTVRDDERGVLTISYHHWTRTYILLGLSRKNSSMISQVGI